MTKTYTNALINESSPYLLQHAHNPVNWVAWSSKILQQAKEKDKLLLISIGYAACHWCHVMEKECFEEEEVARAMNENFINIKIDREERPDIDHIYMDALQMMTGSGGWPLNIVALPDGRPFWGATYVKKDDWIRVLNQLAQLYQNNPDKVIDYATNLAQGIQEINLIASKTDSDILSIQQLDAVVKDWSQYFDTFFGGYKRAPKFMMPVNLDFLLHYAVARQNQVIMEYVNTTLTRMAYGGIFDHIGGGFSRYSVDTKWHVPHFEKMLYDNGQLISLYSKAYAVTKNGLYKKTAEETISFVIEELMDVSGGFYSSLDADSMNEDGKLEEGAYYVWKKDGLEQLLGEDLKIFSDYYNINSYGLWEHGNYVLIRDSTVEEVAKKHAITVKQVNDTIKQCKNVLQNVRSKRKRPRLDDKILTSWNGLMLKGLVDAYRYLGTKKYLEFALKNASFLQENSVLEDGRMMHNHKNGKSTINGYLEDYASVIDAFQSLYQVTFEEQWLYQAKKLLDYCLKYFYDAESNMFFFTSKRDDFVIRRTIETSDNVIAATNSIMAKNLFILSKFFPGEDYRKFSKKMAINMQENIVKNAQSHANWMHLVFYFEQPFYEIAIVGESCEEKALKLGKEYLPHSILSGTRKKSELSLLHNRYVENKTLIYVCQEGTCKLPLTRTEEVLTQLQ